MGAWGGISPTVIDESTKKSALFIHQLPQKIFKNNHNVLFILSFFLLAAILVSSLVCSAITCISLAPCGVYHPFLSAGT